MKAKKLPALLEGEAIVRVDLRAASKLRASKKKHLRENGTSTVCVSG